MKIKDIKDEEIRSLAMERMKACRGFNDDLYTLSAAFLWANTTEGHKFWRNINYKLKEL